MTITLYGRYDRPFFSSRRRDLDLSDAAELPVFGQRTFTLGMLTQSPRWGWWDDETLRKVEELIRYDLGFDGAKVSIKRLFAEDMQCDDEFRWKIIVRSR